MVLNTWSNESPRWRTLSIMILCLGFLLRLRQYTFNRSLWLDEASVAASAFRLYPFRSRLILFLVPFLHLAASTLVDWLASRRYRAVRVFGGCVAVGLVSLALAPSFHVAMRPHNYSDIKGAMAYVRAHHAP